MGFIYVLFVEFKNYLWFMIDICIFVDFLILIFVVLDSLLFKEY